MTLADRLRAALSDEPREPLFPSDDPRLLTGDGVPAAVLIAVTDRPEPGVILTVRRDTLRTHAGQVAFPGGRVDEGEDAVAAAVREAWEELELHPTAVETVATLDPYRTITNFCVTPVLAAVPPDLRLSPHDREVADWFEAPLAHLMDPANQQLRSVLFEGVERHYYEIPWQGRRIWGATAAMLVNLSRRLGWP
jgi:8-oxo-dGTP pyrophosphatase MutT (NUDIX family)